MTRTEGACFQAPSGTLGKRVLVVDDDPIHLKLAALRLSGIGFDVTTARDGVEALQLAHQALPDVILSDVLMPRRDGFSLCRLVRGDPVLATIPVVLTSASFVEDGDRALALAIGATALVAKGSALAELDAVLGGLLVEPSAAPPMSPETALLHGERLLRQLDVQLQRTAELERRCARRDAALQMVASLSNDLARHGHSLGALLDAVSSVTDLFRAAGAALYLRDHGPLRPALSFAGFPELDDPALCDLISGMEDHTSVMRESRERDGSGHAILAVPLAVGHAMIGLLALAYDPDRALDRDELEVLELICQQIAQWIALQSG